MSGFRFLFFFSAIFFLFASCSDTPADEKKDSAIPDLVPADTLLKTVDGGGFKVSVWAQLSPTNNLDPAAKIQYQDYENELYLIVCEEPKDTFISRAKKENQFNEDQTVVNNFCDLKMTVQEKVTALKTDPGRTQSKIGGMDAEIVSFAGKPEGMDIDIFYKAAFIDGGDKLYMLMIWTLDSYKAQNLGKMDQMLYSFRKN